jgi:agmatinase
MPEKDCINKYLTPFGIEKEYTNFEKSRFHVICVPYSETVSYIKGTENGPSAILKASTQVELYDRKSKTEPYLKGISCSTIDTSNDIKEIWHQISKEVTSCIEKDKFAVILGGEHTISQGAIDACYNKTPDLTVIQIDAHADLREEYEGNPFSHACALRYAFDKGINIVQIGIRSLCKEEDLLIQENPQQITTFFADTRPIDIRAVIKNIKTPNLYITIDLDGFDPSVIPHVGTPEPGGPDWYDITSLLEELFLNFNVIAADIVELCPSDSSVVSDFAAAKLLYKLLSLK